MIDLELKCRCGKEKGSLKGASPQTGTHTACMCDDCQAAARWLGRDDILDQWGGTTVFQVAPNRVMVERDHLGLFRLSPGGLHRWYATCCRTPIGNTFGSKGPFVGVHRSFIPDQAGLDEALGPIRQRVQGRYGYGELPDNAHKRASIGFIFFALGRVAKWWIQGAAKPSPFFDEKGEPYVEATILSEPERLSLRREGLG